MVCTFHAVCTRHPETIHASGSASRNSSSAMSSLTGLRSAAARKSSLSMIIRRVPTINEVRGASPPYNLSTPMISAFEAGARHCALRLRQPDQRDWIIPVMVGEVKHLRLALHQHVTLVGRNPRHHQTVAVFLQPHQQLLAHLERRRAVGSAVLDLRPDQRNLSDVVEGHGFVPHPRVSAIALIAGGARLCARLEG